MQWVLDIKISCKTTKVFEFGKSHYFGFIYFFVHTRCSHLLKTSPVVMNMKQNTNRFLLQILLIAFACSACPFALGHFFLVVQHYFLPAAINLLLLYFEKCQTSIGVQFAVHLFQVFSNRLKSNSCPLLYNSALFPTSFTVFWNPRFSMRLEFPAFFLEQLRIL